MNGWTSEELSKIGTAEELRIRSLRRDGTLRSPTTIWVVRDGEDLYPSLPVKAAALLHAIVTTTPFVTASKGTAADSRSEPARSRAATT